MIQITGTRVGRPDYSSDTFIQPIPQVRGTVISTTCYRKEFTDVAPGTSVSFSDNLSPAHNIYLIDITASANVYIDFVLQLSSQCKFGLGGWGRLTIPIPPSFPVSSFTVTITNKSNVTINITYCHYATLLGTEQYYWRPM